MDPNGLIYMGDDIPDEDAARLDGFLRGRAESDKARKKLEDQLAEFKAKLTEMERDAKP